MPVEHVAGRERDAAQVRELARAEAGFFLQFAVGRVEHGLARVHAPLRQAELVAVHAGRVLAHQQYGTWFGDRGDHHRAMAAAVQALVLAALAIGELQVQGLAAEAVVAGVLATMIGSRGFGKTPGVFEFLPSYLPKGKTAEQVRDDLTKAIKAAAPSYGVFSAAMLNAYSDNPAADQAWKEAIAPLSHIPAATERSVPQFLTRGTGDPLITDAAVKEFVDALVKAGQRAEYVQVGGASHAFFDWKPDDTTKATFEKYGVYYAAAMKAFFVSVFEQSAPPSGTR